MSIDKVMDSNILGILNLVRDFYATIGAAIVLFGMTHYSLLHFMRKLDHSVNQEQLLSETAGSIIEKVKKIYKDCSITWTGNEWQNLVNDRNKITHGFTLKQNDSRVHFMYKINYMSSSGERVKEEGELDRIFFDNFIDRCNVFCGTVVIQDKEFRQKNNLEEIKT